MADFHLFAVIIAFSMATSKAIRALSLRFADFFCKDTWWYPGSNMRKTVFLVSAKRHRNKNPLDMRVTGVTQSDTPKTIGFKSPSYLQFIWRTLKPNAYLGWPTMWDKGQMLRHQKRQKKQSPGKSDIPKFLRALLKVTKMTAS